MKRREFMTLLGGSAASISWPLAARAQQPSRIVKIGHIESGMPSSSPNLLAAFQKRLRELGYVEGKNLFIEHRYAEGREERLPQLAAAKATDKIPILFVGGGDPVEIGLVKSLAHPGGNVTGLTFVTVELAAKRVQLLKEAVSSTKRLAIVWNPNNVVNKLELKEAMAAAETLGLIPLPVEN